jgi:hypothetical protein
MLLLQLGFGACATCSVLHHVMDDIVLFLAFDAKGRFQVVRHDVGSVT